MSWKKTIAAAAMTAVVGVTAISAASAATPVKAKSSKTKVAAHVSASTKVAARPAASSKLNVVSSTYSVNGADAPIHTISLNGNTLASVRDLAEVLGADLAFKAGSVTVSLNGHTLKLAANSDQITVDGKTQKLPAAIKNVKYNNYIELSTYVKTLGGTLTKNGASVSIDTLGALLDTVDHVQWLDVNRLIASKETDTGRVDYLVDVNTGKFEELLNKPEASELVISPDGAKAAYTDDNGMVYVIDLATKVSTTVSTDIQIKPELVWAANGSALYYLNSDKAIAIKKLNLADGTITTVLDDKVENKANLSVSPDGKVFTYTVTNGGKVTSDSTNVDADNVAIDLTGTEPQMYRFDTTAADGKAVQLTTSTDDKVYAGADANGGYYISASSDDTVNSVLMGVSASKTSTKLFSDKDVLQAQMTGGKVYVLAAGDAGKNLIYAVDALTGENELLYTVSDAVTEISVSPAGGIALLMNGKTFVDANGHWKPVTR